MKGTDCPCRKRKSFFRLKRDGKSPHIQGKKKDGGPLLGKGSHCLHKGRECQTGAVFWERGSLAIPSSKKQERKEK